MTAVQETAPKPELELQDVEVNSQEGSGEAQTEELFRREGSPSDKESVEIKPKQIPSSPPSPRPKTPNKLTLKSPRPLKKEEAAKKKSSSGIPLRLKGNVVSAKNEKKMGSYRHPAPQSNLGPVINRNTLEMQFINNKKRLLQLHSELVEKQRPLIDIHKSLLRTKKQLEELGKKVVLEDLKIVSLKTDEAKSTADDGENSVAETANVLKNSIDGVLESCVKMCKRCLLKRDHMVKILEDVSHSGTDTDNIEIELEELKREKEDLDKVVEDTFKENESKISDLLGNWQKAVKMKNMSGEGATKISELEEKIAQQQKTISEAEDNVHSLTRKYEDRKTTYEKTIAELHDKINKLEEELKKEKRNANENLMKTRNLRSKVMELEVRTKEAEEKHNETVKKLGQLQELQRKKEIQWLKEKEDLKKNEQLLQQKFSEKQSQVDARFKEMEQLQKNTEIQQENLCRTLQTQLEIKQQEVVMAEREKEEMSSKTTQLEKQLEEMKNKVDELQKQIEEKDKEIGELKSATPIVPAIEYKQDENHWIELLEYKQKINELQNNIQEQCEQINNMQESLKAHAQLAAALKLEKDNAISYSNKLRDILQEARDEIEYKNKTIYKIHEKLVLKDKACDKLQAELKEYEANAEYLGEKWPKNRCQICMSSLGSEKPMDCSDAEVGKSVKSTTPQYVSESLIGMSVKKVDHLRARLDNLKKIKLPFTLGKNQDFIDPFSNETEQRGKSVTNHLRKQIELRGKLYQILQKHADQSCEDFINLLKMTVSSGARDAHELKPSNMSGKSDVGVSCAPHKFSSNIKISESLSRYVSPSTFNRICDKLNESFMCESDEISF